MKYYVIVNPTSGRGLGAKSIPQIESNLRESGLDFILVQTERIWHAAELAEGAARDGYDVIVCASGDGTVNEAINGIMRAKMAGFNSAAFAVLGIGTGNDFAGGTGIPTNLTDGLKALKENKRRKIDIGLVKGGDYPEGRYFGNGIGVGFDAAVGHEAVKVRWARGLPAYLIGVIKTVFLYYNPAQVEIVLDGSETIKQRSLMISVMNGRRMGGGFQMAPDSQADDGLFDLCIAETASKGRILQMIPHFIKGTQAGLPEIQMKRARTVSIKSLDVTFPAHADGEFICLDGSHLTLELLPQELEIIHA
ncbi:MAG: diacylglycerol kinase family lipid kinase [Anaerolineales bacterium]|jgi:YegS/Rv2252/BmrU family lipid kinase|nr:diacylglycerol kinase family lipid kinase [Anaerolineales bacterium]